MAQNASSPGAVAAHGARKSDLKLASWITSEPTPSPTLLQARWLAQRFAVPAALAHVVAEIAFATREARL